MADTAVANGATAQVIDWRTVRDERREREFTKQLRDMGLPMRGISLSESALLKFEVLGWDVEYWRNSYECLARDFRRLQDDYSWQVLKARTDLNIEQAQRLLERLELQAEIERLRGLLT